jgi:hypothetical protein
MDILFAPIVDKEDCSYLQSLICDYLNMLKVHGQCIFPPFKILKWWQIYVRVILNNLCNCSIQ